ASTPSIRKSWRPLFDARPPTASPSSSPPTSSLTPSACASGSPSSPVAGSPLKAPSTRRAGGCGPSSICGPGPPTALGVRPFPPPAAAPWRPPFPAGPRQRGSEGVFELPAGGPEPLLKALIDGGAGIETLSIERPGLHDAFIDLAGGAQGGGRG